MAIGFWNRWSGGACVGDQTRSSSLKVYSTQSIRNATEVQPMAENGSLSNIRLKSYQPHVRNPVTYLIPQHQYWLISNTNYKFGSVDLNKKTCMYVNLSTAVRWDHSYLVAGLNPEFESSSGGTITVYWNAICNVGLSGPCLHKIMIDEGSSCNGESASEPKTKHHKNQNGQARERERERPHDWHKISLSVKG